MGSLTRRVARIEIGWYCHYMVKFLYQHLIFMPLHVDVADESSKELRRSM